jgi:hypothetical protein
MRLERRKACWVPAAIWRKTGRPVPPAQPHIAERPPARRPHWGDKALL